MNNLTEEERVELLKRREIIMASFWKRNFLKTELIEIGFQLELMLLKERNSLKLELINLNPPEYEKIPFKVFSCNCEDCKKVLNNTEKTT